MTRIGQQRQNWAADSFWLVVSYAKCVRSSPTEMRQLLRQPANNGALLGLFKMSQSQIANKSHLKPFSPIAAGLSLAFFSLLSFHFTVSPQVGFWALSCISLGCGCTAKKGLGLPGFEGNLLPSFSFAKHRAALKEVRTMVNFARLVLAKLGTWLDCGVFLKSLTIRSYWSLYFVHGLLGLFFSVLPLSSSTQPCVRLIDLWVLLLSSNQRW